MEKQKQNKRETPEMNKNLLLISCVRRCRFRSPRPIRFFHRFLVFVVCHWFLSLFLLSFFLSFFLSFLLAVFLLSLPLSLSLSLILLTPLIGFLHVVVVVQIRINWIGFA